MFLLQSKGYSRIITPTQFGRILHFLSLNVAPEDFKLLCEKFRDEATGDINYPAFVQTVDKGLHLSFTQITYITSICKTSLYEDIWTGLLNIIITLIYKM